MRRRPRSAISCSVIALRNRAAGQPSLSERSANVGKSCLIVGSRSSLCIRVSFVTSIPWVLQLDRKSVVQGKRGYVGVDIVGRGNINKKTNRREKVAERK